VQGTQSPLKDHLPLAGGRCALKPGHRLLLGSTLLLSSRSCICDRALEVEAIARSSIVARSGGQAEAVLSQQPENTGCIRATLAPHSQTIAKRDCSSLLHRTGVLGPGRHNPDHLRWARSLSRLPSALFFFISLGPRAISRKVTVALGLSKLATSSARSSAKTLTFEPLPSVPSVRPVPAPGQDQPVPFGSTAPLTDLVVLPRAKRRLLFPTHSLSRYKLSPLCRRLG
jgi:hypothetical protein